MKKFLGILFLSGVFVVGAGAQTTDCPADKVCITREAAVEMLRAKDENTALKNLNKALEDENKVVKEELVKTQIELAKTTGEKTQLEASLVRYNAIMDVLIKNSRPKKIGLINLF